MEYFSNIDRDVERFAYAAYFNELVSLAMPYGEKNTQVFRLLMNFLNFLNKEATIVHVAQIFEIKLTDEEKAALQKSAGAVKELIDLIKF